MGRSNLKKEYCGDKKVRLYEKKLEGKKSDIYVWF